MKAKKVKPMNALEQAAVRATQWLGSSASILMHTAFFAIAFTLYFWGVAIDKILLVVTTIVSLEAIYLSIFIQMSMNIQARRLLEVAQDVEDIQENVEEIQEDVEGIEKDVEEIQEDVEGIEKDVEEIQEDVDEIQKDVEEINEEEEEISTHRSTEDAMLNRIEDTLSKLMNEIDELKKNQK